MHLIKISEIKYEREKRLRSSLDQQKIRQLAASIDRQRQAGHKQGLTQPIVLTRDRVLVVGENRIEAHKGLGLDEIWFEYTDVTDEAHLILMELEENSCRTKLEYPDECRGMQKAAALGWSYSEIGEAAGGYSRQRIHQKLLVAKHLHDPRVAKAPNETTALRRAQALEAREKNASEGAKQEPDAEASPIQCTDFRKWAPKYEGPKFNHIHWDPPFGIRADESGQNPAGYHDAPGILEELCATFSEHLDRFCAPDAHMIFWCASSLIHQVKAYKFLRSLPGFTFDEVPLVWHKPTGITPDALRRPRREYEVAFFGWRGEARILQVRSNIQSATKTDGGHEHEKPVGLLRYWFEMFVDETTAMLDPTCGGATSLEAAMACGAGRVLGLEISQETARKARARLAGMKVNFRLRDAPPPPIGGPTLEDLGV
jgi:ParB-like chromosome segregation protein Spo0J